MKMNPKRKTKAFVQAKFGVFALLLLFSAQIFAQQSYVISGKVTDASGAIPGVTVSLQGTTSATSTDADGQYSLRINSKPGAYTLVASAISYSTQTKKIDLANASTLTVNFELKNDVMSLDEVIVVGSTVKESRRQLGNAISSVKAEQISKRSLDYKF